MEFYHYDWEKVTEEQYETAFLDMHEDYFMGDNPLRRFIEDHPQVVTDVMGGPCQGLIVMDYIVDKCGGLWRHDGDSSSFTDFERQIWFRLWEATRQAKKNPMSGVPVPSVCPKCGMETK